jgi:cytoskeletal protein RodZ
MSAAGNLQIKPNVAPPATRTSRDPKVRTLKTPPEIWELVHETRAEFKAGSALVGHLKAINPFGLAVLLLIIGGVAVFSFMMLRGGSASPSAAPPAQAERGNIRTDLSPQSTQPNRTESSPAQSIDTAAPPTDTAASTIDEPKPNVAPVTSSDTADIKIDAPKISVAAPAASSDSRVVAKPRPQNPTSPTTAKGETVAARKKDRDQAATLVKVNTPTVALPDNKDGGKASPAPALKSDKEKSANPPPAKKEPDKALSPQLIAPAKANSSPKAKVIAWP